MFINYFLRFLLNHDVHGDDDVHDYDYGDEPHDVHYVSSSYHGHDYLYPKFTLKSQCIKCHFSSHG